MEPTEWPPLLLVETSPNSSYSQQPLRFAYVESSNDVRGHQERSCRSCTTRERTLQKRSRVQRNSCHGDSFPNNFPVLPPSSLADHEGYLGFHETHDKENPPFSVLEENFPPGVPGSSSFDNEFLVLRSSSSLYYQHRHPVNGFRSELRQSMEVILSPRNLLFIILISHCRIIIKLNDLE